MRLFSTIAALSMLASPAFAASAIGHASATIIVPVTVAETQPLVLGTFSRPSVDTVFALQPNGTISAGGSIHAGSPPSPGQITVVGAPGYTAHVTVSSTFQLNGPGLTIDATPITDLPSGGHVLLDGSEQTFSVGATFTVPSTAPTGSYSGTYGVSAVYE